MLFNRRSDNAEPPQEPRPTPEPTSDFNPVEAQQSLWTALAQRLGANTAAAAADDFNMHVAEDAIHGAEMGYLCLIGKLVDTVDLLTDALDKQHPGLPDEPDDDDDDDDRPVSRFTVFAKE